MLHIHPAPLKYKISAKGNVTYEVKGQMNLGRACLGDLCFRLQHSSYKIMGTFNIPSGTGSPLLFETNSSWF